VRDGSGVPFEGSGKPLFTGMFMIFPWIPDADLPPEITFFFFFPSPLHATCMRGAKMDLVQ
ncbi:hypothetical protein, partial [Enterobacter hormaechei]|uniref:hypothetical protein n=1 Tax=Enterobacter hormaechei TaxID=158836 RepID=UPI003A977676